MHGQSKRQIETTDGARRRRSRRSTPHTFTGLAIAAAALLIAAGLVGGCNDSPTETAAPVVLQVRTVFEAEGESGDGVVTGAPGVGGPAGMPQVAAIDRVVAALVDVGDGETLAEEQLQIVGNVATGRLSVLVSGSVEADLQIRMYEGSRLSFRGVERLTLVAGATMTPTVTMQTVPRSGIRGRVENARVAEPIAGATVEVVQTSLSTTTGSAGEFEFQIDPGIYTLRVSASGFVTTELDTVTVRDTLMTDVGVIALVPSQATGEIAIVLSWSDTPRDLDSHLTGPLAPGGRFHVYFSSRGSITQSPWAALDRDVTGGYGPETISIVQRFAGTYRFSVHDYTNRSSSPNNPSTALSNSGALVRVIMDNQEVASINIPQNQEGSVWRVLEIDGASADITTLNTFEYISDPGMID